MKIYRAERDNDSAVASVSDRRPGKTPQLREKEQGEVEVLGLVGLAWAGVS